VVKYAPNARGMWRRQTVLSIPPRKGASESQMLLGRQHYEAVRGSRVRGISVNAQPYFGRRNEVKT
jgi:hypothetical protein